MNDRENSDQLAERQDEATDKRTLDEIEDDEKLGDTDSDAPTLEPDEGGARDSDYDAEGVM